MDDTRYVIALGSNRGRPKKAIGEALAALANEGCEIVARSQLFETKPVGPGKRRYSNAAAIIDTELPPTALLEAIKRLETRLMRRRGRRWGDRTIDIDIILWSEGAFADRALMIPHPRFRERGFVLRPLLEIAPRWRDPLTRLTVRQITARLARGRAVDRSRPRS